jgi:hypothetical protein
VSDFRGELYRFIKAQRYGVVSSVGADGAPQSALVGIAVTPALEICFDTTGLTRKAPNLRRDPRIAIRDRLGERAERPV